MDPVEDDQLPDDEDDAWQVEQDEEEDNGQQCGQLLMLIISRWEVFLYRIFVDETEESDVGEAHHNDRQYCPKRLRKSEVSQQLYFIVLPKKRIDDRKVDEPLVEICSYVEIAQNSDFLEKKNSANLCRNLHRYHLLLYQSRIRRSEGDRAKYSGLKVENYSD